MQNNQNLKDRLPFETLDLSSLSRANRRRPYQLFEKIFLYLLTKHGWDLPALKIGPLKIIDATMISLRLNLFKWAHYTSLTAAVKLTFCFDPLNQLPEQLVLGIGKYHDNYYLDQIKLIPGVTYLFNRGYSVIDRSAFGGKDHTRFD